MRPGLAAAAMVAAARSVRDRVRDPAAIIPRPRAGSLLAGGGRARSPSAGRTVAIVSAYEQDQDDLRACLMSIVNQCDSPVDEIHVVDDGSVRRPVQPFPHPLIHWHRKDHGGPVAAHVYVLDRLDPRDWDFVLTVAAASVLDGRAVQRQLRAFANPRVMSTSGAVLVRGAREDLSARIGELHAGGTAAGPTAVRTLLGVLGRPAEAPAVHRAHVLFKHRDRYLAGGDDRYAALCAAMEGEVVTVAGSAAWFRAPVGTRHRLDWARAWWRMLPTVLTAMRPRYRAILPAAGVVGAAPCLLAVGFAHAAVGASLCLLIWYGATAVYLARRPGLGRRAKVATWLLLTPAAAAYHLFVVVPVRVFALMTVREYPGGEPHGADPGDRPPSRGPAAGVLYQSGHAVWR
jgi:hyaluronan synthase